MPELENVLERAVILSRGNPIDIVHLPQEIVSPTEMQSVSQTAPLPETLSLPQAIEQLEKELIAKALSQTGGNKARTARLLDISERALWYKVKKWPVIRLSPS